MSTGTKSGYRRLAVKSREVKEKDAIPITIERYIVTNVFDDKWYYFANTAQGLQHAEKFATALRIHERNCVGCNQVIVNKLRDRYAEYVNPVDYYACGYITYQKHDRIELYKGTQIFTGVDNDLGEVLVKSAVEPVETEISVRLGEDDGNYKTG